MIQFWRGIDCHVLCVMVFTIACKYLRLRKLMYKAAGTKCSSSCQISTSWNILYQFVSKWAGTKCSSLSKFGRSWNILYQLVLLSTRSFADKLKLWQAEIFCTSSSANKLVLSKMSWYKMFQFIKSQSQSEMIWSHQNLVWFYLFF